jgi:hypothetical protein
MASRHHLRLFKTHHLHYQKLQLQKVKVFPTVSDFDFVLHNTRNITIQVLLNMYHLKQ